MKATTKKEKLKELVNMLWLSKCDEETIYKAFGYGVDTVTYLYITDSCGDFVCTSDQKSISTIIRDNDIDALDDNDLDEIYEKLKNEYDLGEEEV